MEETTKNDKPPLQGKQFTSDYQPDPEKKSEGWKKKRAEKLLTQKIIEKLIDQPVDGTMSIDHYVSKIYDLAIKGNPKAIETINNGIEDTAQKLELSGELAIKQITGMEVK